MSQINNNLKRDLSIGRQNSRNLAMDFIPEDKKGTDEGLEMWREYRDKFFRDYMEWRLLKIDDLTAKQVKQIKAKLKKDETN